MENILYSPDRKKAVFNGVKYFRHSKSGYYFNSNDSLHRAVYVYYNGQIPNGYEIHHKDGDKSNNESENLECVEIREHHRQHMKNRSPELIEKATKVFLVMAQEEAKKWHKSPEGREWHKKHWHECKDALFPVEEFVCEHCGKKYTAHKRRLNNYCSRNCVSAARRARGVDDEARICVVCGKDFMKNKYSKTAVCSRHCGSVLRFRKEREARA